MKFLKRRPFGRLLRQGKHYAGYLILVALCAAIAVAILFGSIYFGCRAGYCVAAKLELTLYRHHFKTISPELTVFLVLMLFGFSFAGSIIWLLGPIRNFYLSDWISPAAKRELTRRSLSKNSSRRRT